jgi:hypothetical protein
MKRITLQSAFQTFVLAGVCLFAMAFSQDAHAKKAKAVFTNSGSSAVTLKVVWAAAGCAGIKYGKLTVCGSRKIKVPANGTYTYKYKFKWGTSGRDLFVLCTSNKQIIKEGAKNGRTHNFTVKTGQIVASRSKTLKNESCIK